MSEMTKSSEEATEHFFAAGDLIKLMTKGERGNEVVPEIIKELETALDLGLSEEREMHARSFLAQSYAKIVGDDIHGSDWDKIVENLEKAAMIDSRGNYGYFSQYRDNLKNSDLVYHARAIAISQKEGLDKAIKYIEDKSKIFDYLSSTPLLRTVFYLGRFYVEKGEDKKAYESWKRVVEAEPVSRDNFEQESRQKAGELLSKCK